MDKKKKVADKLQTMQNLLDDIKEAQSAHEKNGVCFWTTRKLLCLYKSLKYDLVNQKVLLTLDIFEAYGYTDSKNNESIVANLDYILSLPENITYCSNKIQRFCSSSEPAYCGQFIHLIEAGLKALKSCDKLYHDILYTAYIEEKDYEIEELFDMFKLSKSAYYRHREEAIKALSIIIFGPLGERHPMSKFASTETDDKYHKFFEIADKIDDLFE